MKTELLLASGYQPRKNWIRTAPQGSATTVFYASLLICGNKYTRVEPPGTGKILRTKVSRLGHNLAIIDARQIIAIGGERVNKLIKKINIQR